MKRFPRFVDPALPTLVDEPPTGDNWFHEIKYDGYRIQLVGHRGEVRAFTRRGLDWTQRYENIIAGAGELANRGVCIDGEAVVQDETGKSSFNLLQKAFKRGRARIIYYAFDLLCLDRRDLRAMDCEERRRLLAELLGEISPESPIQFSQAFDGPGAEFFKAVDGMGLEGVVSKRRDGRYVSGRTTDWLKVKAFEESAFLVVGYERTSKAAPSLLLASTVDGKLKYAGRAIPAISQRRRNELWARLEALHADRFAVSGLSARDGVAVRPNLVVTARYMRGEEKLRHATITAIDEA